VAFAQLVPPTAVEAKPGEHEHGRQTAAPAPLKKPAGHLPNVGKVAPVLPLKLSSLYVKYEARPPQKSMADRQLLLQPNFSQ
jgi:hypothetical protein